MKNSGSNIRNVAVVGAGASGLLTARLLSENPDIHVSVFEQRRQIANKLRASGGGRANIFNENVRPEDYNNQVFIEKLLKNVSPGDLKEQFLKLGLLTMADDENRVYPITQVAQTVVDVISDFENGNVSLYTESPIQCVEYVDGKWTVDGHKQKFDALVLSTGSPANAVQAQQIGYNGYLQSLGLKTRRFQPSLVGFVLSSYPKRLSGCRTKAIVSLYQDNRLIHKEKGEVIFKDDGVSGIVVMNASSFYRRLQNHNNCRIEFNLTYWDEHFQVKDYLRRYGSLQGLLHPKLSEFYNAKPFDIQHFSFGILDTYPIESAQVCSGGVDLSEINDDFSVKKYRNLYVTGEMLDIDGLCGGYNLFFAFASAMVVARILSKKLNCE